MGDIDQVLANLKEWANWLDADIGRNEPAGTQLREAATLITSLREALEPFSEFIGDDTRLPADMPLTQGSAMARRQVTVADFRRARTALNPKERLDALLERARSNNPSRKETI
jgi:hypothetical protein